MIGQTLVEIHESAVEIQFSSILNTHGWRTKGREVLGECIPHIITLGPLLRRERHKRRKPIATLWTSLRHLTMCLELKFFRGCKTWDSIRDEMGY